MSQHISWLPDRVHLQVSRQDSRSVRSFVLCALLCSVISLRGVAQAPTHATLRTVREVRELSNVEARNAYPVQLEGIATYSDPEWGLLFLADATGAIYINTHGMNASFPPGSRLRVDAVTGPGDVGTVLAQPNIHVLGQGQLPEPERRSIADLDALKADSHFIETRGVLWACDQSWKRICFRIADGKVSALVVVPTRNTAAAQKLVGATVRVHGVSGIHLDPNGKPLSALVFVNRLEDIEVEGGASQNLNSLAVIVNKDNPVANLSTAELREILLGKREHWKNSQKIIVLLPNGGSPEREVALRMVDMNEASYKQYWLERTNAGGGAGAPASVPSSGIALSLVAETRGAISVVPLADVRDSVKVVKIDGHLPSDAAYPMH